MSISGWIKNINNQVKPYHSFMVMMIFFIGSFWSVAKFFFSKSDFEVIIDKEAINYPSNLNENFHQLNEYLIDSTKNGKAIFLSDDLSKFLLKTKDEMIIQLNNNSNKTLKGVQIKIINVVALTSKAISSSYMNEKENNALFDNLIFDEANGIVTISNAITIPPKENLKIFLWGDFYESESESIIANYEDGDAKMNYQTRVTGWQAFISNYFIEIFLLIAISFALIHFLMIRKYKNGKTNYSNTN